MLPHQILQNIGLPNIASIIYLRLFETGASSARKLAENLDLPRPTVYDNLKLLISYGLVVEKKEERKKFFVCTDSKNLLHFAESKIETLEDSKKEIKKMLSRGPKILTALEPQIKFYSGASGVKQVLKDLLWYENIETLTMWPISEMIDILGREYLENLNRRRIRQKISIRGIWPSDKSVDFKEHPYLGVGQGHLRELRMAPNGMTWNMSFWLYADKVAFISSQTERFGFVIHSKDFADLIRVQFEQVWKISKSIKAQPAYTDGFLRTV